jgi:predicted RNA-binding protein YlqC (UPF0109 family)
MSSNRSVPQPQPVPQPTNNTSYVQAAKHPDYVGLVRSLVQPFLESPDSLSVDCEVFPSTARVWIRLAFEGEDKGRVFGRGGRNIQAIRTVLTAAAAAVGQSVHLDIFGGQGSTSMDSDMATGDRVAPTTPRRSVASPKPVVKPPPAST